MSRTLIIICNVPDLAGFPPSKAVNTRWITGCFSLSKAFCRTNNLCSPPLCTSSEKCSLGLSL
uniref:Uncharacterized protein n=1 Tax=Paramormyrops kingsleyae TaxID=1676925 RepID=A0A3B3T8I6_9TELE